jgi:hypothetical protein
MRVRSTLLSGLLVATVWLGSGCVEDGSFYILQNQVPGTGCVIGTSTTTYRPQGVLDISGRQGYQLFPLMVNDLLSTAAVDKQPERNRLAVTGYKVKLDMGTFPGSFPSNLLDFFASGSASITPGGGMTAGQVEVIPTQLVQMLNIPANIQPVVEVEVTVVATKTGVETESAAFNYAVKLCNGCLVDFRDTCPSSTDTTIISNTCGIPQDEAVTCCEDSKKMVLCYKTSSQ